METLLLTAVACAFGMLALATPNIIAIGGLSVFAVIAISMFCWQASYTPVETILSVMLFVAVCQIMFLGPLYVLSNVFGYGRPKNERQSPMR
jgi:hypothetical protein